MLMVVYIDLKKALILPMVSIHVLPLHKLTSVDELHAPLNSTSTPTCCMNTLHKLPHKTIHLEGGLQILHVYVEVGEVAMNMDAALHTVTDSVEADDRSRADNLTSVVHAVSVTKYDSQSIYTLGPHP
jgi:hypothetical protein